MTLIYDAFKGRRNSAVDANCRDNGKLYQKCSSETV